MNEKEAKKPEKPQSSASPVERLVSCNQWPFEKWCVLVKKGLVILGAIKPDTEICKRGWRDLWEEGMSPHKAINVNMEREHIFTPIEGLYS